MELCKGVLLTVLGGIGSIRSMDNTAMSGPRAVRTDSTKEGECGVLSICIPRPKDSGRGHGLQRAAQSQSP